MGRGAGVLEKRASLVASSQSKTNPAGH